MLEEYKKSAEIVAIKAIEDSAQPLREGVDPPSMTGSEALEGSTATDSTTTSSTAVASTTSTSAAQAKRKESIVTASSKSMEPIVIASSTEQSEKELKVDAPFFR
ncbi:unnamed protein product, partial [Mesorhabditis belari]|uniref:Uncharacterized protein n=1 Tax=Mesorhabditis belari TaxID=2138241 RepID=A0AAF3J2B2_9BILA